MDCISRRVIETHIHADFLSGHLELAAATGALICYGEDADVESRSRCCGTASGSRWASHVGDSRDTGTHSRVDMHRGVRAPRR